ncbi:hypothetical protein D3C74_365840 [compost metagenome]
MSVHIHLEQGFSRQQGEPLRLLKSGMELAADRLGSRQQQCFGQITQQLMKMTHHREDLEHLSGGFRSLAPIPAVEGNMGNFWTCTKAFIYSTTSESVGSQSGMNPAAKILPQVRTRLPGIFIDGKVR